MEMSLPQNDNESVTIEPTIIGEKPKKSKRKEKKETEKLPRDNKVYFGMFMIFKKTFTEMFGATRVIAYVLLSVIFPFIYSNVVAENLVVPLSDLNINFQIATAITALSCSSILVCFNDDYYCWFDYGVHVNCIQESCSQCCINNASNNSDLFCRNFIKTSSSRIL